MSLSKTKGEFHFINTTLRHYYSISLFASKNCATPDRWLVKLLALLLNTHTHPQTPNSRGGNGGSHTKDLLEIHLHYCVCVAVYTIQRSPPISKNVPMKPFVMA